MNRSNSPYIFIYIYGQSHTHALFFPLFFKNIKFSILFFFEKKNRWTGGGAAIFSGLRPLASAPAQWGRMMMWHMCMMMWHEWMNGRWLVRLRNGVGWWCDICVWWCDMNEWMARLCHWECVHLFLSVNILFNGAIGMCGFILLL